MISFFSRFRDWRKNYILILQFGENLIPFICKSYKEVKDIYKNIGVDVDNYVIYQASAIEIMKGENDGK